MSTLTDSYLSSALRTHAASNGWPQNLSQSLGVHHHDGHVRVSIPDHLVEQAMDLEYGTPSTPPSAAVRQFLNRTSHMVQPLMQYEDMQYMVELGYI